MAWYDWLTGDSNGTSDPATPDTQVAVDNGGDWSFGFLAQQDAINSANSGATPDAGPPQANSFSLFDPGTWGGNDVATPPVVGPQPEPISNWSLLDPTSWFAGDTAQANAGAAGAAAGAAAANAQADGGGWLSSLFGGFFGGAQTPEQVAAGASQEPGILQRAGNFLSNLFGGDNADAGQEAADQMLTAILAGKPAAEAVSSSLMDTWRNLFGGTSSGANAANQPGMFDALGGLTQRLQQFAQQGTPAEQAAANSALLSFTNLNPGQVTTDVISGVKGFLSQYAPETQLGRDRTNNVAAATDQPLDVSQIPAYDQNAGGGGYNFPNNGGGIGNMPVVATSGGFWGALWSDNPLTVTKIGPEGWLQLETNTPLLKRSILLFGMPIPLSILAIAIGLCVYYRKPLGKYLHKLIKK